MVQIELGKAYIDKSNLVVCVHSHNPRPYGGSMPAYSDHVYTAMCLSLDIRFVSFYSTYNSKGQFDIKPELHDVVREATLEELEYALSRHKRMLCTADADKIVSKFYEAWKKHNP